MAKSKNPNEIVSVKKRKYDYVATNARGELMSISKKKYDVYSREIEAKYKQQKKMGATTKKKVATKTTPKKK